MIGARGGVSWIWKIGNQRGTERQQQRALHGIPVVHVCITSNIERIGVNTEVCSRWLAERGWERSPFRPLRDRSEVKWHTMRKSIFRGRRPLCFLEVATVRAPSLSLFLFLSYSFLLIRRAPSRFGNHRIIAPWDPIGSELPVCGRRDQWTATREIALLTVRSPIFLHGFCAFPLFFLSSSARKKTHFNLNFIQCINKCAFFRILRN